MQWRNWELVQQQKNNFPTSFLISTAFILMSWNPSALQTKLKCVVGFDFFNNKFFFVPLSQVCQSVQWNAVWLQYWFDKLTKTQYIGLNGENMRQCISLVTKSNFTASLNNSMVAQVEKSKSYIQKAGFFGFQNLQMILIFW